MIKVLEFCGLEKCLLDASGRIKFGSRILADFQKFDATEVVLHCLPEGALAIYPVQNWQVMKAEEEAKQAAVQSVLRRRQMRMMGAMTRKEKLSNQGRVTLPQMFREMCSLLSGEDVVVVGCEMGVELWNVEKWNAELALMQGHALEKGQNEMSADLEQLEEM